MKWNAIESGWNDYKANAQEQWSKLSTEQIEDTQGKRELLSRSVQQAYSVSSEEAERQISDWQGRQREKQSPAANQ